MTRRLFSRPLSCSIPRIVGAIAIFASLAPALSATAANLSVTVVDQNDAPLADAVVYAVPTGGKALANVAAGTQIGQIKKRFEPLVSVIQAGAAVNFPNQDTVRHHVYSFSPAKVFELKLYSGVPAKPVVFDKPGLVVLGCNIHDHMLAYVLVVETPYFAKTGKDGVASLADLPTGDYEVKAWHHGLPSPDAALVQKISVKSPSPPVEFKLTINPNVIRPASSAAP